MPRVCMCAKGATRPCSTSESKFESHCGWPSFDDEIPAPVKRIPDADVTPHRGIVCANCGAHLGHVFEGEYLTPKNVRHCVNSVCHEVCSGGVIKIFNSLFFKMLTPGRYSRKHIRPGKKPMLRIVFQTLRKRAYLTLI